MSTIIEPSRGMRDVPPADMAAQLAALERLEQVCASYGYQPIDLPIIEQRDLYGRKLGEELVGNTAERLGLRLLTPAASVNVNGFTTARE